MAGRVAIQQAMFYRLNMNKTMIARIMGVCTYTIWQHVNAFKGSNVRPWQKRTKDEKYEAEEAAIDLIAKIESCEKR